MNAPTIAAKLAKLESDAPRCSVELEARALLATVQNREALELPIPDSELESMIDDARLRLKNDARLAALFRPLTDPAT